MSAAPFIPVTTHPPRVPERPDPPPALVFMPEERKSSQLSTAGATLTVKVNDNYRVLWNGRAYTAADAGFDVVVNLETDRWLKSGVVSVIPVKAAKRVPAKKARISK
jgi:hypothetical protein